MTEADIEPVQQVELACFKTPWSASTYRRELRNRDIHRYLVARTSHALPPSRPPESLQRWGRLISSLIVGFFLDEQQTVDATNRPDPIIGYGGLSLVIDEGHITMIAVEPLYRGAGIGELLLNG